MSIPPSSQPSSPPPSSDDSGPKRSKGQKEFRLPDKKNDQKKKNLFDLPGGEVEAVKQEISQQQKAEEVASAGKMEGVEAKMQVSQISRLIQKMVANMQIGSVEGKNFARLSLADTPDVPHVFANSNLTLSYAENGLRIHFDNFDTPQQEQNAMILVEKNKEQLTDLMQALQAKNIQVTELSIGSHTVALPRVQPLPPPFQIQPSSAETQQQQREGGEEGEGGRGGEPE